MKKTVGGALIGLGLVLLLLLPVVNVQKPHDVGVALAPCMPGLLLLIVGLAVAGSKEWVPPRADPPGGIQPPTLEELEQERIAGFQSNGIKGVFAGVAIILLATNVGRMGGTYLLSSLPVVGAGWGLFVWGCANYMIWKGYPARYGLLGILLVFGLVILAFLPNKRTGTGGRSSREIAS